MKMKRFRNNIMLIFACYITMGLSDSFAQAGFGVTMPNASAQLEVAANNKGVLIPRVALKTLTDTTTISNGNINSLLVYNTAVGSGLVPGFFYWEDGIWKKIIASGDSTGDDLGNHIATQDLIMSSKEIKDLDAFTAKNGKLTGLVFTTDTTDSSLVIGADGTIKKGIPSNISPLQTGSVIVVNGKMEVAQEMMLLMKEDFSTSELSKVTSIGNITNVVIDNQNKFTSSSTSNSFSVSSSGIYQIIMNCQLSTVNGDSPVIGLWNNTTSKWVARVNDHFASPTNGLQVYTLITVVEMNASDVYSFSISSNSVIKVTALSSGSTGTGATSFYGVKRVK
jgi:hypothetical protein